MSVVRKSVDWSIVMASGALFLGVMYWGFCDFLDGVYVNPILEMGTRSAIYTHNTTKQQYHPGEMVYANIVFRKNRNIHGLIQWHLINDSVVIFQERSGSLPVGVWDKEVPVEKIPIDTTPGYHWFCGTVRYQPNWIGKISYPIWTNKFEVVAK